MLKPAAAYRRQHKTDCVDRPTDGMSGTPPGTENFSTYRLLQRYGQSTVNTPHLFIRRQHADFPRFLTTTPDNNPAGYPHDPYLASSMLTGGLLQYHLLFIPGNARYFRNALQGKRTQGGHVISFTTGGNLGGDRSERARIFDQFHPAK